MLKTCLLRDVFSALLLQDEFSVVTLHCSFLYVFPLISSLESVDDIKHFKPYIKRGIHDQDVKYVSIILKCDRQSVFNW